MENYKKKAIELIADLTVNEKKNPAVISYVPAKVASSGAELPTLKRCGILKRGRAADELSKMIDELTEERRANIHNYMVVKNGEVICEASAPGYGINTFHAAHSMSKSVTALAVGMLVDEEKLSLDEKITDIFPEMPFCDPRFADITVEDLLTMRSGVPFAEIGSVTTDKWTETYFDSELSFAPGTEFHYNSMNSYILAKIVTRVAKRRLSDYVEEKLFAPLGINNFLWELSPEGCERGGYGLYLSCESFAKIGMLILDRGEWLGKRIISESFIDLATTPHVSVPDDNGGFDYGYHIWVSPDGDEILLNGMLGQNVLICRKSRTVVSVNAGNNELFSKSPALDIIRSHVTRLGDEKKFRISELLELRKRERSFFKDRHWIRPLPIVRSHRNFFGLFGREPFDNRWDRILGSYAFADNNAGLIPIFVSVLQNNYPGGLERITLEKKDSTLHLVSTEGGIAYDIPIGLYGYIESSLNLNGERYIVRAFGEATEDEDRNPVYKIELVFPELPNVRRIKITREECGIKLRLSETPNNNVAERFFASFSEGAVGQSFAMGLLERKMGRDFIETRLAALFNPELFGIDRSTEDWESMLAAINRDKQIKRESDNRFVKNVVNRFIGEEKPKQEKPKPERDKSGGFLAKAFYSIVSKFSSEKPVAKRSSDGVYTVTPLDAVKSENDKEEAEKTEDTE